MDFRCAYTELVQLSKLVPNPDNNNIHSLEQIQRLADIIQFNGQRSPIVVSNRSGRITKGHARLEALKLLAWDKAAVDYQDYKNEDEEYADITADNEIARWAELDLDKVKDKIKTFENFDVNVLGIKDFEVEIKVAENVEIDTDDFGADLEKKCPKCGFEYNE